jgi:hypothetical protein
MRLKLTIDKDTIGEVDFPKKVKGMKYLKELSESQKL